VSAYPVKPNPESLESADSVEKPSSPRQHEPGRLSRGEALWKGRRERERERERSPSGTMRGKGEDPCSFTE